MAVTVREPLPWGLPIGWADWITLVAEREHLNPADVVVRALTNERARLGDAPRVNRRTRRPGVNGMASRLEPGLMTGPAAGEILGDAGFVRTMIGAGCKPARPSKGAGDPIGLSAGDVRALALIRAIPGQPALPTALLVAVYKKMRAADVDLLLDGNMWLTVTFLHAADPMVSLARNVALATSNADSCIALKTRPIIEPLEAKLRAA